MKTLITCTMITFGLFIHVFLHAQCPTGNIELDSQDDVNNFPAGCTTITGTLTIWKSDITDLSPLGNITTIDKGLRIVQNAALTNLNGLENITSVGGYLRINSNDKLTNLNGLKNLSSVGAYIEIVNNPGLTSIEGLTSLSKAETILNISKNGMLTSLSGLDNISSIGKYLVIRENDQLTNMAGLGNLESIETGLRIQQNGGLTTLKGLNKLSFVGGNINILSNSNLTDLKGLEGLTSTGGFLKITQNPLLSSLQGLKNLTSIDGYIKIRKNNALTSLSGLENIDPGTITNLLLTANGNLYFCHLPNICEYLNNGGRSNITKNIGACASKGAIQSVCESLVNVSSIESLEDITVECNTSFEDVELPATVEVTLSNSETVNLSVKWEEPGYDKTVGTYYLTGILELMGPIANPDNRTAKFTIVVEDTEAPHPNITALPDITGKCFVHVTDIPTAADNCTGEIMATTDDPIHYVRAGNYTITWTYDDGNGNMASQNQKIIVETTAPRIECPGSHILSCSPIVHFDLPETKGDCGPISIVHTDGTGLWSGSEFPVGMTTLTFRAFNAARSATCSIDIEVLPQLEIQHTSGVQNGDTIHIHACNPPDISKADLNLGKYQNRSTVTTHIYQQELPSHPESGLWKISLYSYDVKDQCGNSGHFENYVALYDMDPPVYRNFPQNVTIGTPAELPPVPGDVRIFDICRYVVWDTVTTTPILDPETSETLAFVRRWMAEDGAGNKSFRDQMIYIRSAARPDNNEIRTHIAYKSDPSTQRFPQRAGLDGIPVSLYKQNPVTGEFALIQNFISGNWMGRKGNVYFTSLSSGKYRIKVHVPEGFDASHPDTLVLPDGWSDTLSIYGNTILDLGTILLVPEEPDSEDAPLPLQRTTSNDHANIVQKPLDFTVYPNPTEGIIKIALPGETVLHFTIFNQLGQMIQNGVVENGSEIDLSNRSDGMYFIRMNNGKSATAMKRILLFSN